MKMKQVIVVKSDPPPWGGRWKLLRTAKSKNGDLPLPSLVKREAKLPGLELSLLWEKVSVLARSAVRCHSHPASPAPSVEMTAVLEGDVFRRDCVAAPCPAGRSQPRVGSSAVPAPGAPRGPPASLPPSLPCQPPCQPPCQLLRPARLLPCQPPCAILGAHVPGPVPRSQSKGVTHEDLFMQLSKLSWIKFKTEKGMNAVYPDTNKSSAEDH
ncbi:uncharacterized protein LOC116997377 [Catharus ustulatus]|uniref:uncharacterized protein LOC116997377 n=1 Tax=Catharus ustulatus TaxID=91951 RepID=UPI001409A266|nr:uncharacterized protein LOC116997377 [Catharus ustulatus]